MQFEHNGKTYEVSAMTEFQSDMRNYYLVQVGQLIVKRLGLDSLDNIPASLDKLASTFIDWYLVTKIDGQAFDFLMMLDIQPVFDFAQSIANDSDLYRLWGEAYKQVNKLKRDPVTEKNDLAPEAESKS